MNKKKILTTIMSLTPLSVYAGTQACTDQIVLHPGEAAPIGCSLPVPISLTHAQIAGLMNSKFQNPDVSEIEVKFHEETGLVDFGSLDGHSVTVPLSDMSIAPENVFHPF